MGIRVRVARALNIDHHFLLLAAFIGEMAAQYRCQARGTNEGQTIELGNSPERLRHKVLWRCGVLNESLVAVPLFVGTNDLFLHAEVAKAARKIGIA